MSQSLLAEVAGLVALALCITAFASKKDDRLLIILILGNVAFAAQFFMSGGLVAGAVSSLVVMRILLVRRLKGNVPVMAGFLLATILVAAWTWQGPWDLAPTFAGVIGTYAMFMLRGIPMRVMLAAAAVSWMVANYFNGSMGAFLAEGVILITNLTTIYRLSLDERASRGKALTAPCVRSS